MTAPSWAEHIDVAQAFIVLLITIIGWYFLDHANAVKEALKELKEEIREGRETHEHRIRSLEVDFYTLKGEHDAHTQTKPYRL